MCRRNLNETSTLFSFLTHIISATAATTAVLGFDVKVCLEYVCTCMYTSLVTVAVLFTLIYVRMTVVEIVILSMCWTSGCRNDGLEALIFLDSLESLESESEKPSSNIAPSDSSSTNG